MTAEGGPDSVDASAETLPAPATLRPEALTETLDALRRQGADRFDTVRFGWAAALARRVANQGTAGADRSQARALALLGDYLEDLRRREDQLREVLDEMDSADPALVLQARQLLARHDIAAVRRLLARHRRRRGPGSLAALTEDLRARSATALEDEGADAGFSASLQAQMQQILASYAVTGGSQQPELRAARRYREALLRSGAWRQVAESVAQQPAEPGPLNPQKLGTEALAVMRSLSPACSVRYVAYLNTLSFLESLPRDQG